MSKESSVFKIKEFLEKNNYSFEFNPNPIDGTGFFSIKNPNDKYVYSGFLYIYPYDVDVKNEFESIPVSSKKNKSISLSFYNNKKNIEMAKKIATYFSAYFLETDGNNNWIRLFSNFPEIVDSALIAKKIEKRLKESDISLNELKKYELINFIIENKDFVKSL